jgi:tetratricopeptide (TPR) repeat protein
MPETPSELQNELVTLERKHAENPEGRFFVPLANSYRQLGQLDRAEALLRDGLRAHPEYLSAHIVLGRCLADRQRVEEAVDEFRYVLSLDPQNLVALRTLGELAAGEGDRQEAERWYEELLAVDPMNEDARRALESLAAPGQEAPAMAEPEIDPLAGWAEEAGPPSWENGAWESWPAFAEEDPGVADRVPRPVEQDLEFEALYSRMAEIDDEPAMEIEPVSPAALHLFDLDDEDRAGDAGAGDPEVVTETIAELYARQGLPERAAEVYRELIRRRGGDPALELRLRELEQGAARAGGEEIPVAAVEAGLGLAPLEPAEPQPEAAETGADLFADSVAAGFEAGWPEDLPAAAEPATLPPAAGPDGPREETEPPARTIGGELRELLAWRPAGDPVPAEPVPAEPVDAEPEHAGPSGAAAGYDGAADGPGAAAGTPAAGTAEADGGTVPAEEELFPWELPEPEPEPEQPGAAAEEIRPEPAALAAADAAQEPPARPREEPASSRADEDDDDLESFQEWLRSLRR